MQTRLKQTYLWIRKHFTRKRGTRMDEAMSKVSEGKLEEALAIYDINIATSKEQRNPADTFELLLGKSLTLILLSRFKESALSYEKAVSISQINESHISHFIDNLVNIFMILDSIHMCNLTSKDRITCSVCRGIHSEPTTLSCGHTICLNCVAKLDDRGCIICSKPNSACGVKVNVILQEIIRKYFKNEFEASCRRLEGNALLKDGKRTQALEKYEEAVELDPKDPPLNSNIALLMTQNGKFEKALQHANMVCKVQPGWAKGFYRKGCALIGLQRKPEAAFAFLQCLARDPENKIVRKLVTEVIQDMFNESIITDESVTNLTMIAELMELFEEYKETRTEEALREESEHEDPNEEEAEISKLKECDAQDFECTLCCRLFYKPVTTPCGHVFCKNCLNRSLDHRPDCPICRSSLSQVLALRNQNSTDAIENFMQTHLADEYEERKKVHIEEMEKLASVASNTEEDIPIFVCTLAFPTLPCPLHIFEPRYRLMIRQCMESGSKQFGMCTYDEETGFAEYGTMLVILDVQFLPDGRSLVNTIGGRRFKVLSKGTRDGYSVAKVEWITDDKIPDEEEADLKTLLREVFDEASSWFNMLPLLLRRRIVNSVSEMPVWQEDAEKLPHGPEWLWWLVTVCPLDPKAQLAMLGLKSLKERLLVMRRVLAAIS